MLLLVGAAPRLVVASESTGPSTVAATASDATSGETVSQSDARSSLRMRYSLGFDYSRGDYGLARDSQLFYVPIGVTADLARLRLRAVVPFLVSDGPTVVLDGATLSSPRLASETNGGLGEIQLSTSYLFDLGPSGLPLLELGLRVTAPTRSKIELGTGGWAFAPQLDLFQRYGRVTPFVSAGRQFFTVDSLDDRFFTSVGTSIEIRPGMSLGLAYDWLEATNGRASDAHELVPFLSFGSGRGWSLGPYGVVGLSDGSPELGLGISLGLIR